MKYIALPVNIKITQLILKTKRKLNEVFNKSQKTKEVQVLSFNNDWGYKKISKKDISVKFTKPPISAYMFFPLGKGPDLKESCCFVGYKNNKVCGWAWLHNGMRKDTATAHNITKENNVLWFGPDYVSPKYRGNSIQKLLIQARLEYVKNNFNHNYDVMTLVGSENIASLKSYNHYNFFSGK